MEKRLELKSKHVYGVHGGRLKCSGNENGKDNTGKKRNTEFDIISRKGMGSAMEAGKLLIGIDVGTTGTKSVLVQEDGTLLGRAYEGYECDNRPGGFSEQDAEALWQAVANTVKEITKDPELRKRVVGISLSTQGGTLVVVDEDGNPIHPAIVWTDHRCKEEREEMLRTVSEQEVYEKTGWSLGVGLNALEIMWLQKNKPEVFRKAAKFLSVPDYITYKLTGKYAIDLSNAGINQLADIQKKCWDPALIKAVGITEAQLPELFDSGDVIGTLSQAAQEELLLPADAVVSAGGHDQYCVALGAGALNDGDVFIATGTAWVVTGIFEKPHFDTQVRLSQSRHTVKGMWGSLISLGTGGVCLEWLRKNLNMIGEDQKGLISYRELDNMAKEKGIGANGLFFYPYFSGASYPIRDSAGRAAFLGLELAHDRFDFARAVMEGVTYQIVWTLEAFQTSDIKALKLVGGATNSPLWVQMVADISGMPILIPEIPDMACIGAAVLAGIGAGVFQSAQEGYRKLATRERKVEPIQENVEAYRPLYERYRKGAHYLADCYHGW